MSERDEAGPGVPPKLYLEQALRASSQRPPAAAVKYGAGADLYAQPSSERVQAFTVDAVTAARDGNIDELARHRPDASSRFGVTLLHKAARAQNFASVQSLVHRGAERTACDVGRVPLHDCVWAEPPDWALVEFLVVADPQHLLCADSRNWTPLDFVPEGMWGKWRRWLDANEAWVTNALGAVPPPPRGAASPRAAKTGRALSLPPTPSPWHTARAADAAPAGTAAPGAPHAPRAVSVEAGVGAEPPLPTARCMYFAAAASSAGGPPVRAIDQDGTASHARHPRDLPPSPPWGTPLSGRRPAGRTFGCNRGASAPPASPSSAPGPSPSEPGGFAAAQPPSEPRGFAAAQPRSHYPGL